MRHNDKVIITPPLTNKKIDCFILEFCYLTYGYKLFRLSSFPVPCEFFSVIPMQCRVADMVDLHGGCVSTKRSRF